MSNSVFRDTSENQYFSVLKESGDVEDKILQLQQNLVILVNNKSGKMSVDERTLHSLLSRVFFECLRSQFSL